MNKIILLLCILFVCILSNPMIVLSQEENQQFQGFNLEGYSFKGDIGDNWLFIRENPEAYK